MRHLPDALPAAILFDLDGTLVDSLPDLAWAINQLLAELARKPASLDDVRSWVGDGVSVLVERCLMETGGLPDLPLADAIKCYLGYYRGHATVDTRPFPGVLATLTALRTAGHPLGVCTNKPTDLSIQLLDALGMSDFFLAVIGGDGASSRKPHPEHLWETLDAMGMRDRKALMVGDSLNDVAAAKAAGIPVVAVSFGYTRIPVETMGADVVIDDFADLIREAARFL
jgi:phosphoglycolate phosphatase